MANSTTFKKGQAPWNKGKKHPKINGNKHAFKGEKRCDEQFRYEARNLLDHIKVCSVCLCKKKIYKNGRNNLITHHKD